MYPAERTCLPIPLLPAGGIVWVSLTAREPLLLLLLHAGQIQLPWQAGKENGAAHCPLVHTFPNPYKAGGESVQGQARIEFPVSEYIVMFMQRSKWCLFFPTEQGIDFCEIEKRYELMNVRLV